MSIVIFLVVNKDFPGLAYMRLEHTTHCLPKFIGSPFHPEGHIELKDVALSFTLF